MRIDIKLRDDRIHKESHFRESPLNISLRQITQSTQYVVFQEEYFPSTSFLEEHIHDGCPLPTIFSWIH